jgi:hypothetical protein
MVRGSGFERSIGGFRPESAEVECRGKQGLVGSSTRGRAILKRSRVSEVLDRVRGRRVSGVGRLFTSVRLSRHSMVITVCRNSRGCIGLWKWTVWRMACFFWSIAGRRWFHSGKSDGSSLSISSHLTGLILPSVIMRSWFIIRYFAVGPGDSRVH